MYTVEQSWATPDGSGMNASEQGDQMSFRKKSPKV
jgi:hypothetical protein